jgi:tetratricopeptide (TPR) repeat protein
LLTGLLTWGISFIQAFDPAEVSRLQRSALCKSELHGLVLELIHGAQFGLGRSDDQARRASIAFDYWREFLQNRPPSERARLAPLVAELALRVPIDERFREQVPIEDVLREGIDSGRVVGDSFAVLSGSMYLLQFFPPPLEEGEELISASMPVLPSAPLGHERTFRMVAAEYRWHYAEQSGNSRAGAEQALAILEPLLERTLSPPTLNVQQDILAGVINGELGRYDEAIKLLRRARSMADFGSEGWFKSTKELGLDLNDIGEHKQAVDFLKEVLPLARERAMREVPLPGVHRGFHLSEIASALSDSLMALGEDHAALRTLGMAFLENDGSSASLDVDAVAQGLGDGEVAVVLFIFTSVNVFFIQKSGHVRGVHARGIGVRRWADLLESSGWLEAIEFPERGLPLAEACEKLEQGMKGLLDVVIEGLQSLEARSVVLLAQGWLAPVPFWLFRPFADMPVTVVHSPTSLVRPRTFAIARHISGFVDPSGDLPMAHVEAAALKERLETDWEFLLKEGSECTADQLHNLLPSAGWFHFAGHAFQTFLAAEGAYLEIAGSNDESEVDMAQLDSLQCQATSLVVLSACSSGKSEVRVDNVVRPSGLAAAFLQQGAASVICSLWEVDDAATALLMDELAFEIRASESPVDLASVLRAAAVRVSCYSPAEVIERLRALSAHVADPAKRAMADRSIRRLDGTGDAPPYASINFWGAFFVSGARWVSFTT